MIFQQNEERSVIATITDVTTETTEVIIINDVIPYSWGMAMVPKFTATPLYDTSVGNITYWEQHIFIGLCLPNFISVSMYLIWLYLTVVLNIFTYRFYPMHRIKEMFKWNFVQGG